MKLSKTKLLENVALKIKQSNYFLVQMEEKEKIGDVDGFYYVYSAFLSSSRSALQYLETHRKNFYKKQIKNVTLKEKFRIERNIDIHQEPSKSLNLGMSCKAVSIEVTNGVESTIEEPQSDFLIAEHVYQFYFKNETNQIDGNRIVEMAKKYLSQIIQMKEKLNN